LPKSRDFAVRRSQARLARREHQPRFGRDTGDLGGRQPVVRRRDRQPAELRPIWPPWSWKRFRWSSENRGPAFRRRGHQRCSKEGRPHAGQKSSGAKPGVRDCPGVHSPAQQKKALTLNEPLKCHLVMPSGGYRDPQNPSEYHARVVFTAVSSYFTPLYDQNLASKIRWPLWSTNVLGSRKGHPARSSIRR
jgi:hypothetical protein